MVSSDLYITVSLFCCYSWKIMTTDPWIPRISVCHPQCPLVRDYWQQLKHSTVHHFMTDLETGTVFTFSISELSRDKHIVPFVYTCILVVYFNMIQTPYPYTHLTQFYWMKEKFYTLTLVLLNQDMSCLCKQCRSRSVGFFRSQLIWICTVCHSVFEFVSTTWIN